MLPTTGKTQPEPHARALAVERFTLVVTSGRDTGASATPDGERLVVGSGPSATLVLSDPTVSRLHCEIVRVGERLVVRDLGSLNGTQLDGVSVLGAHLSASSVLTVGKTRLRVVTGGAPLEVALSERVRFGVMVGVSPAMRRVFSLLERVAASDATVLVHGETGAGKEAVAESIHRESGRADGPFVVVDCGAIPPALLESELFGHERGAFTGAVAPREGAFEAAAGGTVFLDEIGELPLDLQPKLLRVLETRKVKRVGANEWSPVDVRVVAATHRDLAAEVNTQRFRADLYYRLAVLEVRLPPLRARPEDLPSLVEHILENLHAADRPAAGLCRTAEFFDELARHRWPGNVRELRNYVERCLALEEQVPLGGGAEAAAPEAQAGAIEPLKAARDRCVRRFERAYLDEILRRHDSNVSAAARAAGIDRANFYRLLWRHGIHAKR